MYIIGTKPLVEILICLAPIFNPFGLFIIFTAFITLSKLSSGSPIPINTILEILMFSSCSTAKICSTISPLVKLLTNLIPVEAQNLQPILHPICEDTQML